MKVTSFERKREPGKPFAFTPLTPAVEDWFAHQFERYTRSVTKCEGTCGGPTADMLPDGERVADERGATPSATAGTIFFVRRWYCPHCRRPAVCALEMTAELHEFLEGVTT